MSIKSRFKKLSGKVPEVGENITRGIWDIIINDLLVYNRRGDLLKGFNKITFYTDDKRLKNSLDSEAYAETFKLHFINRMESERTEALNGLILGVSKGWYKVLSLDYLPKGAKKVENLEEPFFYNVGYRSGKSVLTIKEVNLDKSENDLWSAKLSKEDQSAPKFRLGRWTGDPSYRKNEISFPEKWTDVSRHQCTIVERGGEWFICADCEWPVVYLEREPVSKDKFEPIPGDCELQLGYRRRFIIRIESEFKED